MRRVLMTTDTVGGVFTYSLTLARALAAHDFVVHLATMGPALRPEQRDMLGGIAVHESTFDLEWMDDPWFQVDSAGAWLRALAHDMRPSIVHLNGYAHGAIEFGAPSVVVAHSCVLSWWEAVKGEPAPAQYDEYRRRVADGLRGADRVIAVSAAMRAALSRHYGYPKARVIHNGATAPARRTREKEPFVLACGRAWDMAKNVGALARIAPALPWPVKVAGWGTEHHPALESFGWLDAAALGELMERATIFVAPARYEPFGLAALEAALRGCALVLGDIPSQREIWGDAAVYVDPADDGAIADAIIRLAQDASVRASFVARSAARAAYLTAERTARDTAAVYASLIGAQQGASACA